MKIRDVRSTYRTAAAIRAAIRPKAMTGIVLVAVSAVDSIHRQPGGRPTGVDRERSGRGRRHRCRLRSVRSIGASTLRAGDSDRSCGIDNQAGGRGPETVSVTEIALSGAEVPVLERFTVVVAVLDPEVCRGNYRIPQPCLPAVNVTGVPAVAVPVGDDGNRRQPCCRSGRPRRIQSKYVTASCCGTGLDTVWAGPGK